MNDLEKQFAAERRMMVDDALNKLNNKYDKLQDEMTKRQGKELRDLMVSVILQTCCIMLTCPCNVHPLTPHFYIVKLGFTGVYIIFLFLL